jgi:hypothetical protein
MSDSCPKTNLSTDVVRLPKGTVVKLNGFPCELAQDTEVYSTAIAGMGLEAFPQWTEGSQGARISETTEVGETYS